MIPRPTRQGIQPKSSHLSARAPARPTPYYKPAKARACCSLLLLPAPAARTFGTNLAGRYTIFPPASRTTKHSRPRDESAILDGMHRMYLDLAIPRISLLAFFHEKAFAEHPSRFFFQPISPCAGGGQEINQQAGGDLPQRFRTPQPTWHSVSGQADRKYGALGRYRQG